MLGMIFGVAAVVAMLSIGAGAQQQVMAFIEQLGVRNLIVEARETTDFRRSRKCARCRRGSRSRTSGSIQATVPGLDALSPRKRFTPSKLIPKPQRELPMVYGVEPNYLQIAGLQIAAGRFFGGRKRRSGAGLRARRSCARRLFGLTEPLGQYVKVNGSGCG